MAATNPVEASSSVAVLVDSDFPPLPGCSTQAASSRPVQDGGLLGPTGETAPEKVMPDSGTGKASWTSLFDRGVNPSLQFFPPVEVNGKVVVRPPVEVIDEGTVQWENALVGQFLGTPPNLSLFQKVANILWGRGGNVNVQVLKPRLFLIEFPSKKTCDWVLEAGPWHVQHKPLVLRRWAPGIELLDLEQNKTSVWVSLLNVPLELFSQKGLSYLASAIGRPLYTDMATASRKRIDIAKICVEIDTNAVIPPSIEVDLGRDELVEIKVVIGWSPPKCSHCQVFGHSDQNCTKTVVQKWVPKANVNAMEVVVNDLPVEDVVVDTISEPNLVAAVVAPEIESKQLSSGSKGKEIAITSPTGFDALATVDVELVLPDSPRKKRIATGGFDELMLNLKNNGKGGPKKRRPKGGGSTQKGTPSRS